MNELTIKFLTDFCKETGKDMKNQPITGYNTKDYLNGVVRIDMKNNNTLINVVELMSFMYSKTISKVSENDLDDDVPLVIFNTEMNNDDWGF